MNAGLGAKLIVVPVVALTVVLTVSGFVIFDMMAGEIAKTQDDRLDIIGEHLEAQFHDIERTYRMDVVQSVVRRELQMYFSNAQDGDGDALRKFLQASLRFSRADDILALDRKGRIVGAAVLEQTGTVPEYTDLLDAMYALEKIKGYEDLERTVFAEFYVNQHGKFHMLVMGPILNGRAIDGAFVIEKRLDDHFLTSRLSHVKTIQLSLADFDTMGATTFADEWKVPPVLFGQQDFATARIAGEQYRSTAVRISDKPGIFLLVSENTKAVVKAKSGLLRALTTVIVVGIALLVFVVLVSVLKMMASLREVSEYATRIASGDLTMHITSAANDEVGALALAFADMAEALNRIAGQIIDSSAATGKYAQTITVAAADLARGADTQTAQATQIATAVGELALSIQSVAQNASDGAAQSQSAHKLAQQSMATVDDTVAAMDKIANTVADIAGVVDNLGKQGTEIGRIVAVIDGIAEQTNLLALNAGIEAARAGEHGRGFAVVADEVRTLAGRTAQATREISDMITKIQDETRNAVNGMQAGREKVKSGVAISHETRAAVSGILESSNRTMDMVNQIAAAAEQQSAVAKEVSDRVESIVDLVRSDETHFDRLNETAASLARNADGLKRIAEWFRIA